MSSHGDEKPVTPTPSSNSAQRDVTVEQSVRQWIDLMETCDQLLRAGIRASLKPGEDFETVYRAWHKAKADEHERVLARIGEHLAAVARKDDTSDAAETDPRHT